MKNFVYFDVFTQEYKLSLVRIDIAVYGRMYILYGRMSFLWFFGNIFLLPLSAPFAPVLTRAFPVFSAKCL